MDGYTVEEAASVLGVPRERVWELLARGVLSGSADLGGAMRVRLKADPPRETAVAPPPLEPAVTHAPSDTTPFRELLTEFRSLTERYGQALLALGEARGEVATLRSRVDLLEARVDLRLPAAATATSWSSTPWPTPTARADELPVAAPSVPQAAQAGADQPPRSSPSEDERGPDDEERGTQRRRGRSGRRATESFADALARANDPSPPVLPGAAETAAALAALRADGSAGPAAVTEPEAEAIIPRDLPAAEQVPVAEETEEGAASRPPSAGPPTDATPPEATSAAPPPRPPPAIAPDVDPFDPTPESGAAGPDVTVGAAVAPGVETPAEPAVAKAEPDPDRVRDAARPVEREAAHDGPDRRRGPGTDASWDAGHYSADIEEPGWISAEDVPGSLAGPVAGPPDGPSSPGAFTVAEETVSVFAVGPSPTEAPRGEPEAAESDAWPGSRELDEALAALDAIAHPDAQPAATSRETAERVGTAPRPGWSAAGSPDPHRQPWTRSSAPPPLAVRSSASRAYRRLRRIFPT